MKCVTGVKEKPFLTLATNFFGGRQPPRPLHHRGFLSNDITKERGEFVCKHFDNWMNFFEENSTKMSLI